jgi:hypothetical protein
MNETMRWVAASTLLLTVVTAAALHADPALPTGPDRAPVPVDHFPTVFHAVVFRNWELVDPAKIAAVVGTPVENVTTAAAAMGLPPARPIDPQVRRRGFITILRRNWHLMPYEQLLALLDMTADELAFTLREDDTLFLKFGSVKPRCAPVRFAAPTEAVKKREAEIKAVIERRFGAAINEPGEPPFDFVRQLSQPMEQAAKPVPPDPKKGLRFIYSYFALYGDPLLTPELDPFPDGLLQRLAQSGVNGVWLHVVLRQLAPGGPDFPEFGKDHEKRLENLRKMVRRAKAQGVAVYLYMNEPRAMPLAFFKGREEMRGVREGDYAAMCTADPRVKKWLSDSLAYVFKNVPDLGGVFTITASENLTSCASHFQQAQCPRCSKASEAETIAGVNAAIEEGVHRGNPEARVICWDWGWARHGDAPGHIALTPKNTWLMSVSEWDLPIERGGVKSSVGEYSMSAVGPGPRAMRHWKLAHEAGLKTVAKMQVNNTWELSAVPYLPVMDLLAEHCENLAKQGVDGSMLSWSLGGYPSPNLEIARRFNDDPKATREQVLDAIAEERYGKEAAPAVRRAWSKFSAALREFPYDVSVLYVGPQQYGPANLLYEKPTGYAATMVGFPYDDLERWRGPYPAEVFAGQWRKVAAMWEEGLADLRAAAKQARDPATAAGDLRVATAAWLHFASVENQVRYLMARPQPGTTEARSELLEREIATARRLYDGARADSRIGFEASNQYYYRPLDLVEKVVNCEWLKARLAAEK